MIIQLYKGHTRRSICSDSCTSPYLNL